MHSEIVKRVFDLLVSLLLLAIAWPVYVLMMIVIYFEDGKNVFFYQKRIGKDGVVFELIKFRSMVVDAERSGSGLYSYQDDPRVTKVGKIIRKASLDELPQIFNVIRGDMSIVGPRPPVTYELGPWESYTPEMLKRFNVKPGITGLAQVSGRNENNWDRKIELDNKYVLLYQKYGVLIDLKILLQTIVVVFSTADTIEISEQEGEGDISRRARAAAEEHLRNK